jgi:hypothetical protein
MTSRPPAIRIQQSMGGCFLLNMLLLILILPIDVTFSTPTRFNVNDHSEHLARSFVTLSLS